MAGETETIGRRCLVSGRVQGVFFRASTARRARALKLDGWARNLPDGRVEVLMRGDTKAVEAMSAWLWHGPPTAEVSDVSVAGTDEVPPPGFATG